ncbi:MAG TPA: hypothetical protein PLC80_05670 [Draconibacterium sp.]|nr:hypothetical protein [Draconibacterium sp.]
MADQTIKIFLASSIELEKDRDEFRIFISGQNDRLHKQGIYLEIVQWENFLDAISDTRLQDEYNKALRGCDIALCLFFTKVGKYTAEEFNTAYEIFKDTGRPKIWTYFKDAPVNTGSITEEINTLILFKKKINELGHFHSVYTNIDNLINQFRNQLDKFLPELAGNLTTVSTISEAGKPTDSVKNTFNEKLTRGLIEAMAADIPRVQKFLDNANRMAADWETQERFSDPAKELIALNYVGVLGIQLRKLIAIGKEEFSVNKQKKYLDNCRITAKRALQLTCFVLISKLWDEKKEFPFNLTNEQYRTCINFFEDEFEWEINGLKELLKSLIDIFNGNNLTLPIAGLNGFDKQLQPESKFVQALEKLHAVGDLSENVSLNLQDCLDAEGHLITVLTSFNFLAGYKMISIKSIDYLEMRNTRPQYLYNYTDLCGIENKSNKNPEQEKIKYEDSPINTDAVFIYKDNYKQGLNLFPFIIDMNALSLTGGQKICFYAAKATADGSLNYSFIEDNSIVNIKNTNTLKPGIDVRELMSDSNSLKDLRFDTVFNLFREAKKAITGAEDLDDF